VQITYQEEQKVNNDGKSTIPESMKGQGGNGSYDGIIEVKA
jgi:hypothetical protein